MKNRPFVAILNTLEAAGAQVISSAASREWGIVKTSAKRENLIGPIPYGAGVRVEYFAPQAEVRQLALIGCSTVKETIVASTRYRVEIGNPESTYESTPKGPIVFAYTSSASLSGNAVTDRAIVYRALRDRINNYAGANCTAYTLTVADFTLGTSAGDVDTNFVVGETVTQETSALTARVAKCTITSGTFAADTAAGKIWLFALSNEDTWLTTLKTLTAAAHVAGVSSNCVVSVTNATTIHACGLAVLDNAGYFTSSFGRGGVNYVGVTQGFATDSVEIAIAGQYPMGIGSHMATRRPVYDESKQNLISGNLEYEFQNNDLADAAKTYDKCVIVVKGTSKDNDGMLVEGEREYILYIDHADGDLADFKTALNNAIAL